MRPIILLVLAALLRPAAARARESASSADVPAVRKSTAAAPAPIWRRRRRPRYKNLVKKKAPPPKRKGPVVHLPGRWLPGNRDALEKLIFDFGFPAKGEEPPETPPAAVFVLDDAALVHHAGEAVFYRMVTNAEFKFDDDFWGILPPPQNYKIRMGYDGFKDQPRSIWPREPFYKMYRKSMFEAYQSICADQGEKICRGWLASLLRGFKDTEIQPYMKEAVESELARGVGREKIAGDVGDLRPVRASVGMEIVPEIKELIRVLSKHGFEVRLISTSNQWAAEILAEKMGIAADHVDGIRMKISTKTVTADLEDIVPEGTTALAVETSRLGRHPLLVVAPPADKELLSYGTGVRMVIEPVVPGVPPPEIGGWLIQPAFGPAAPQKKKAKVTLRH